MSEDERRRRAEARRARGITFERFDPFDEPIVFDPNLSIAERLSAMTRLCRAAWLATGRPMPPSGREHRATLPGEVYFPFRDEEGSDED